MEALTRLRRPLRRPASGRQALNERPLDPSWERPDLWQLFQLYKVCMARVEVEMPDKTLANGAAFHIGDGYMVTARHVIEDSQVTEIVAEHSRPKALTIVRTFVPDDPKVDLAILETDFSLELYMERTTIVRDDFVQPKIAYVPLGGHLDDWIGDELVLTSVLAMGYPRVPLSADTQLVASVGEINGVVDRYDGGHPHFIVSTMGRGGFSGGPVIHEWNFLLGIYTGIFSEDLERTGGFPAVLSIEPLLVLMHENGIFPGENGRMLRELISDEPIEDLLRPNIRGDADFDPLIAADHARRELIARKRAANPRYRPHDGTGGPEAW